MIEVAENIYYYYYSLRYWPCMRFIQVEKCSWKNRNRHEMNITDIQQKHVSLTSHSKRIQIESKVFILFYTSVIFGSQLTPAFTRIWIAAIIPELVRSIHKHLRRTSTRVCAWFSSHVISFGFLFLSALCCKSNYSEIW